MFMDEINVTKAVSVGKNPHVLKMLGCVTATNPMMLVLQFVPLGNLKNYPLWSCAPATILCVATIAQSRLCNSSDREGRAGA